MTLESHAYTCPVIIVGERHLRDHAVVVNDGRISQVVSLAELRARTTLIHLDGAFLAPGLVDIHVHGADGRGYNEGDLEANRVIGRRLLRAGITTALPTLASDRIEILSRAIPLALEGSGVGRPRLPGVQLEGPYLCPEQAGAQDPAALRVPSDGSFDRLLELAAHIAVMALAPELDSVEELIRRAVEHGIVVAAAHSNGTASDLRRAQDLGLSHVTHLFSSQSTTTRVNARRVPGMLEGTLISDGLTVEMIADGHHLPDELMQLAYRCLAGRLCLVSDASPGAGLANGATYRMAGLTYRVDGGVGKTLDGTFFGGSTTLLSEMVPIAQRVLGISVGQAVSMATTIPARAARLANVGLLAPGYHADMVLLGDHLQPLGVALGGKWQFYGEGEHENH